MCLLLPTGLTFTTEYSCVSFSQIKFFLFILPLPNFLVHFSFNYPVYLTPWGGHLNKFAGVYTLYTLATYAKSWLIRKGPDAGNDWRQEEKGRQRTRCLNGITNSMDMSLSKLWEMVKDWEAWLLCSPWGLKESDSTEWLNNTLYKWMHVYEYLLVALSSFTQNYNY